MNSITWRTVLPALLAIASFTGVVFLYLLPSVGRVVMGQKRLMIRELTESAWNVVARCEHDERSGRMSREQAQAAAIGQARNLHYGQQNKDYFFIIDQKPTMLSHPYRPDLEGRDLTDFVDSRGKRLFVEMVETVARDGAGYVRYMWQWKDDSERIAAKLSYVKGFEPWGWIIGTGVYTADVETEIRKLNADLRVASTLILAVVSLLLYVLLRASHQADRERRRFLAALRRSEEKYRALVESAGESILMAIGGEGLYANLNLLRLLGYQRAAFSALRLESLILATDDESRRGQRHWEAVSRGIEAPSRYETQLVRSDGRHVRVMLTLSRVVIQQQEGFMAVVVKLPRPRELDVDTAASVDDLEAASLSTHALATMMTNHGADALQVCHRLSTAAEGVMRRAVKLTLQDIGEAPVPFDVMLMGSLGRREVTLAADQDHALIFADVDSARGDAVQAYFLRMGRGLVDVLSSAGYPACAGRIMASERACCQSLQGWHQAFDGWTSSMQPEALLHARIFFDFRSALGEGSLLQTLQAHLTASLRRRPLFITLLAHNILLFEPPLNAFGNPAVRDFEHGRQGVDIKGVMAQIVDIARLRALQHGIEQVGTIERLRAAAQLGRMRSDTAEETVASFEALLSIRMQHHARLRANKLDVDNIIDPHTLESPWRDALKQAFGQVKALQESLRHEFGARQ